MIKIIAETAFSHQGNFDYLIAQIDAASKADVDFVKFQIFLDRDQYIVPNHPAYEIVKDWMFTPSQWKYAIKYANKKKLKVLVLPLNLTSIEFCFNLDTFISIYEIHPVCFKDYHLVDFFKKKIKKKIIIGIGGRTIKETEKILFQLEKPKENLILMFGFQSFPTNEEELNLGKIFNFKEKFKCEIGYADHSAFSNNSFLDLSSFAYFLGVKYFEKHLVLEKGIKRVDYESAIEYKDFVRMKNQLIKAENIFGIADGDFLNKKELLYKNREKLPVYAVDLGEGRKLMPKHFCYKIIEKGKKYEEVDISSLIGKVVKKNVLKNQLIINSDFK